MQSSRGSSVLRHGNGDKLIVKKDHDQHYVYFSVRDGGDNGSLIDLAMRRKSLNLGQVRKELRPWIGKDAAILPALPALPISTKDRLKRLRPPPRTSLHASTARSRNHFGKAENVAEDRLAPLKFRIADHPKAIQMWRSGK